MYDIYISIFMSEELPKASAEADWFWKKSLALVMLYSARVNPAVSLQPSSDPNVLTTLAYQLYPEPSLAQGLFSKKLNSYKESDNFSLC